MDGVVTCTDTKRNLDIEMLTKFWKCVDKEKHGENYHAKYECTSGGMEVAGIKNTFLCPLEKRKLSLYNLSIKKV